MERAQRVASVMAVGVVALALAGCTAKATSLPSEWVESGSNWVAEVSWTATSSGALDGQIQYVSASTASSGDETDSSSAGFSGIESDGKLTLNLSSALMDFFGEGTLTGTVNGKDLTLQGGGLNGEARFIPANNRAFQNHVSSISAAVDQQRQAAAAQAAAQAAAAQAVQQQQNLSNAMSALNQLVSTDIPAMQAAQAKVVADEKTLSGLVTEIHSYVAAQTCISDSNGDAITTLSDNLTTAEAALTSAQGTLQTATQSASSDLSTVSQDSPGQGIGTQTDDIKSAAAAVSEANTDGDDASNQVDGFESAFDALPDCEG